MSISSIDSVLQQMRSVTQANGAALGRSVSGGDGADEVGGSQAAMPAGGFAGELQRSLARISDAQQHAYGQAEAFELGKPGVALNDVMVDMQKANIGFQMGLQVRNRVVTAYQDIMNMQA